MNEDLLIKFEHRFYKDIEETAIKINKNFCVAVDRFTLLWIITLILWWFK